MRKNIFKIACSFIIAAFFITSIIAQEIHEPKIDSDWVKPYPPFRIAGNLYYVGTYDLGCYLITTKKGNILINTGTAVSPTLIKNSIEQLGFNFTDIKILLVMHAHFDHAGGVADIKEQTGAKVMAGAADEDVLESGGKTDYELGKYGVSFKPVKPDRLLHDGDVVKLGDMQIKMLHNPGHTKGSCSYLFTVKDSGRSYRVLIANMPSIITDKKFADITAYPTIQQDYAYTLNAMKNIQFDIWLAAHASQFNLHQKHSPGSAYNPSAFMDKEDYYAELNELQKTYDEKLKKDAEQ
jgi:metallo-beta-lactamase class B